MFVETDELGISLANLLYAECVADSEDDLLVFEALEVRV